MHIVDRLIAGVGAAALAWGVFFLVGISSPHQFMAVSVAVPEEGKDWQAMLVGSRSAFCMGAGLLTFSVTGLRRLTNQSTRS